MSLVSFMYTSCILIRWSCLMGQSLKQDNVTLQVNKLKAFTRRATLFKNWQWSIIRKWWHRWSVFDETIATNLNMLHTAQSYDSAISLVRVLGRVSSSHGIEWMISSLTSSKLPTERMLQFLVNFDCLALAHV